MSISLLWGIQLGYLIHGLQKIEGERVAASVPLTLPSLSQASPFIVLSKPGSEAYSSNLWTVVRKLVLRGIPHPPLLLPLLSQPTFSTSYNPEIASWDDTANIWMVRKHQPSVPIQGLKLVCTCGLVLPHNPETANLDVLANLWISGGAKLKGRRERSWGWSKHDSQTPVDHSNPEIARVCCLNLP